MKFRNKKTSEVYNDIKDVYNDFIQTKSCNQNMNTDCELCGISSINNGEYITCECFVSKYPKKAAEIMGYEVTEDELTEAIKSDIEQESKNLPPEAQELYRKIVTGEIIDEQKQINEILPSLTETQEMSPKKTRVLERGWKG